MSEAWTWTYLDADGRPAAGEGLVATEFPTQADAEAWFGDNWEGLADAGVNAVVLLRDGEKVYGPMSLEAAE